MILENAKATFRDQGDGWTYWLVDYYDPSGETQTEPQDSPTFTRDVNGDFFDTDKIYLAASDHPLLGDGIVAFRFDPVTGLPVIIGGTMPGNGNGGGGNGNTVGGYDALFTNPQSGQNVTFFTLPGGKKVLINTDAPTLDTLAEETPRLQQDVYEATRAAIVDPDGHLGGMAWARLAAYVAVLMENPVVGGLASRIAAFLSLDQLARISLLTVNLIFRGAANILFIRDVGENTPAGLFLNRAGKGFIWGIYFDESGNLVAKVDGLDRLLIRADQFAINHDTINLNGTITANDIYQRFPAVNNNPDYFLTGQQTDNGVRHGIVRIADFERLLFSRPAFQNLVGSSANLIVLKDEIECYDEVQADPVYDGPYTVTAATLGSPRPHLLNVPGAQILPVLTRSDGSPETALVVSFPSNNTYQVDYAVPGDSGYSDNGALELKKRKS